MASKENFQNLSSLAQIVQCMAISVMYIIASAAMIHLNKWMMAPDRFPYPTLLCSVHMMSVGVISWLLYLLCPSLFPSMKTEQVDKWFLLKFAPLGICFAFSIILSNAAYKYLSVALIQMLKESNCAMVFVLSLFLRLEVFSWTATFILGLVMIGSTMAAYGEIHFVWMGIGIQLLSQMCEVLKLCIQNLLMSSKGSKLDPLTSVLFMAPSCFLISFLLNLLSIDKFEANLLQHAYICWPQLVLSCLIAVGLNVIIAVQIYLFSAVGFILAGVMKDITIISVSAFYIGEVIAPMQWMGFILAILGCMLYSTYKMHIKNFEDDQIISGFSRTWHQVMARPEENEKLLGESKIHEKSHP